MAKLKDDIVYQIARFAVLLANCLSEKSAYKFGGMLGRFIGFIFKKRKQIAFDNIKQAFNDKFNDDQINAIVKQVFTNIGRTLIEFCRFEKVGRERYRQIIKPDGLDILEKVKSEGKGGILVTAHFGNWEMLGAYLTNHGYNVDAMVAIQHNNKIDKMVNGFRKVFEIGIIHIGGTNYRQIFKALRNNRFVIIVPDQHDPSASLIMDFFNRKTTVARGPALFAIKNQCPIIPILNRRIDYDHYQIMVGEPIYSELSGDEENDVINLSRKYMDYFEKVITEYPEQWMWTHRRWKI